MTIKNTTENARSQIRKQVRTARIKLSEEHQRTAAKKLFSRLIEHSKVKEAKHIAITLANDGEIDTFQFITWCWANKKHVYLPVIHPNETGRLLFLEYSQNTEMVLNRYGISEPKLECPYSCAMDRLEIIFTPLVAFDRQGNRIGMGGGYYDRMLAPWFNEQKGPYPIGLAHDCQKIESIPIEKWDVPPPEIITPSKLHQWE